MTSYDITSHDATRHNNATALLCTDHILARLHARLTLTPCSSIMIKLSPKRAAILTVPCIAHPPPHTFTTLDPTLTRLASASVGMGIPLGLASPDGREAPLYASDIPGSIFGMMGDDNASDWSLRKLPNLLRQLPESTQKRMVGITTPMIYAGMFGTVFSWHTEDQSLSSLNYLHTGAPKSWYGIKPSDAFRSVMSCPVQSCPAMSHVYSYEFGFATATSNR